MGRPSKFTDAVWQRILDEVASGKSVREVCLDKAMPATRSVWKWMHLDPDLREQFDRAKAEQLEDVMDQLLALCDDLPDNPDPGQVAKRKLQVNTRQWVASKLLPKKYGERVQQDVTVSVDHESVLLKAIERLNKGRQT